MEKLPSPLIRAGLWLLSFPLWSRLWGRIVRLRRPRGLSRWMIRSFARSYAISMAEYRGTPEDYASLGDFFIRPLDPAKRLLQENPDFFLSPADGRLSRIDLVKADTFLQVKGHPYPLSAVLGEAPDFSGGWHVATIYLAPFNYHRYHYPVSGCIKAVLHTGRRLFPVNALSVTHVRRLFMRNERITVKMESGHMPFYFVAVGATFVGSIRMEFLKQKLARGKWQEMEMPVSQAAEMGRFEQGSTIILAVPFAWVDKWLVPGGEAVRAGIPLFRIKN